MSTKDNSQYTWPKVILEIFNALLICAIILFILLAFTYKDIIKTINTEYYPTDCSPTIIDLGDLTKDAK